MGRSLCTSVPVIIVFDEIDKFSAKKDATALEQLMTLPSSAGVVVFHMEVHPVNVLYHAALFCIRADSPHSVDGVDNEFAFSTCHRNLKL